MTMTFYLLNLDITCYLIADIIRYCIVCNMVFSDRGKILIKKFISVKGI